MGLSRKQLKLLDHLFKDVHSTVAFTSVEPLLREARARDPTLTRGQVRDYLATQRVYTLHRRARRRYPHMPTLAAGLHTEWQADLAVFDRLAKENRGYRYLLVCIDTLSRQLFVEPVKSKQSAHMVEAFERLFKRAGVVPWKLVTDQGLEFTARPVQKYFRSLEMDHFCMFTSPQFHAGMAERANRSIKERLYRYFTERQTQRWIDVVQLIVDALNRSPNTSIGGRRPMDIDYGNAEELRQELKAAAVEANAHRWRKRRFRVGDTVRIEKYKHVFEKGYLPNFTTELFVVDQVRLVPQQPPTYRLRDRQGEPIRGWFYGNDLCRVLLSGENATKAAAAAAERDDDDPLYDIERVIRRRKKEGVEYLYVKWKGYGPAHNSWIPASSTTWKNT